MPVTSEYSKMLAKWLVDISKKYVCKAQICKKLLIPWPRSFSNMGAPRGRSPPKFNDFPFSYHEVVEVKIDDICNIGTGVGKYRLKDGQLWTVFVPNVIPGEICKVRIYRNFTSFSESDLSKYVCL